MTLPAIDIVFVVLILIFAIRTLIKGFVSEVFSMASLVLGLLAALYFFKKTGGIIREKLMPNINIIPEIIAFVGLFLIVFLVFKILEKLIKGIIEGIKLSGIDRFLGLIFGIIEGLVVVSLVLFIFNIQPLFNAQPMLENSFFARIIMPFITINNLAEIHV